MRARENAGRKRRSRIAPKRRLHRCNALRFCTLLAGTAPGEQGLELGQLLGLALLEPERPGEAVVGVHEIDIGRMHDGVAAVVLGHLVVRGTPAPGRGRNLLATAREGDDARVESREILLESIRRVALRIDGDEDHLQSVGVSAEALQAVAHLHQRGRTHVRAMREAEEDGVGLSRQRRARERLAVVIGELERPAEAAEGLRESLTASAGPQHRRQPEPVDRRQSSSNPLRCARRHATGSFEPGRKNRASDQLLAHRRGS